MRRLLGRRPLTIAGLVVTLALALVLLRQQPVQSPWWIYADADATYTSSGLNLLAGHHTRYLDHPGLPLQELMVVTVGARVVAGKALGEEITFAGYADHLMLDLDRARIYFRGLAIAIFLGGTALLFVLFSRLFRDWWLGLAAALLWFAAPGLVPMSIQFRPDVALTILTAAVAYLITSAVRARSLPTMAAAAALVGLTITVKILAAALLVPFLLGLVLVARAGGWHTTRLGLDRLLATRPRRLAVAATAVAWLGLVVALNASRLPFTPTAAQATVVLGALVAFGYWGAFVAFAGRDGRPRRGFASPAYLKLAGALAVGIVLPASLVLDDGFQMFVLIADGLVGGGINQGIEPFGALDNISLELFPLEQALVVFVVGLVGAVVGAVRGDFIPALWAAGALAAAVMAAARLGSPHYFAPAFVLSIPPALWLLARFGRAAPVAAAGLVALVVLPQFTYEAPHVPIQRQSEVVADDIEAEVVERLGPTEVAVTPDWTSYPDVLFFGLVEIYVEHTPAYDYRLIPDHQRALDIVRDRGMHPTVYVTRNPPAETEPQEVALVSGRFVAKRRSAPALEAAGYSVLELVRPVP